MFKKKYWWWGYEDKLRNCHVELYSGNERDIINMRYSDYCTGVTEVFEAPVKEALDFVRESFKQSNLDREAKAKLHLK